MLTVSYITLQCTATLKVQYISVYDEYIIASSGIFCSVLEKEKKPNTILLSVKLP